MDELTIEGIKELVRNWQAARENSIPTPSQREALHRLPALAPDLARLCIGLSERLAAAEARLEEVAAEAVDWEGSAFLLEENDASVSICQQEIRTLRACAADIRDALASEQK